MTVAWVRLPLPGSVLPVQWHIHFLLCRIQIVVLLIASLRISSLYPLHL